MPSNQHPKSARRVANRLRFSLLATALGLVCATSAAAQDKQPEEAGPSATDQAIIITGSRLGRSTFDTPTPVTVIGAESLKNLAVTNIGASINQLPAMRASVSPATQGFGSFNVGANIVNLRGLGVTRNLVLVDGRRFAPSTREGSVDLNLVPSIMVERIEVVTGGASAAYGSDAVAGAVNLILDKSLQGIKGQADYGLSGKGDGDDFHAALAFGTKFGGDAGHFIIGGEYDNQKGIGNCFTRSWCKVGGVVTNGGYNGNGGAGNGLPNLIRSDDNAGWFFNTGGVVSSNNNAGAASIRNLRGTNGITFAPNGSVQAYHPGSPAFALSQVGGDLYPTYTDANITVPVERYTGFAHVDYDVGSGLSVFAEGSLGHIKGTLLQTSYFTASLPIFRDNPYIPTEVRALVGAPAATPSTTRPLNSTAVFNLGRVFDDVGRGLSISTADSYRFTTGLKGDLGSGWDWDAYYQYGRTDRVQTVENNLVTGDPTKPFNDATNPALNLANLATSNARFYYALDAVTDPVSGNPTCRALLSPDAALRAAAAGCVPINLFGAGNVSPQAKAFIFGTLREDITLQQHVGAANIRGEVPGLAAGPISLAAGAEYRVDKIKVTHDALSNQYAYFQNFGSDYNGTSKVLEGYAEVGLPLLKDVSLAKSLSLDGALRVTHYDIQGFGSYLRTASVNKFTKTTWKISGQWEPVDGVRIRVTQSHDIRAPNFAELYLASAGAFTSITNRFTGNTPNTPAIFNGGSPNLKPETADTTTAGIVVQPSGPLAGLRLSVDYYRIRVKDYIGTAPGGAQQLVDRCFASVQIACNAITFGPGQTITQIRNVSLNLDSLLAQGIDIEAQYRYSLGEGRALTWRGLATFVRELKATNFGQSIDRAGQTGQSASTAAPSWIMNSYLGYDSPLFNVTVQGRYISPGKFDASYIAPGDPGYATTLPNSINNNRVAGRFYVNLFGTLRPWGREKGVEIFGAVNNLFDRAPPAAPETQFYTNPTYFDTIGRYFRLGVRFQF